MKEIGMIGIGLMGHGIASNLLKHGYPLSLLAHAGNQPLGELVAAGANVYQTPAELARHSQIVIVCVTGTPQVEDALLGAEGVLKGLQAGPTVIDCSTAIPASTEANPRRGEISPKRRCGERRELCSPSGRSRLSA